MSTHRYRRIIDDEESNDVDPLSDNKWVLIVSLNNIYISNQNNTPLNYLLSISKHVFQGYSSINELIAIYEN